MFKGNHNGLNIKNSHRAGKGYLNLQFKCDAYNQAGNGTGVVFGAGSGAPASNFKQRLVFVPFNGRIVYMFLGATVSSPNASNTSTINIYDKNTNNVLSKTFNLNLTSQSVGYAMNLQVKRGDSFEFNISCITNSSTGICPDGFMVLEYDLADIPGYNPKKIYDWIQLRTNIFTQTAGISIVYGGGSGTGGSNYGQRLFYPPFDCRVAFISVGTCCTSANASNSSNLSLYKNNTPGVGNYQFSLTNTNVTATTPSYFCSVTDANSMNPFFSSFYLKKSDTLEVIFSNVSNPSTNVSLDTGILIEYDKPNEYETGSKYNKKNYIMLALKHSSASIGVGNGSVFGGGTGNIASNFTQRGLFIPYPGRIVYLSAGSTLTGPNASNAASLTMYKNGGNNTFPFGGFSKTFNQTTFSQYTNGQCNVHVNAGDYFEFDLFVTAGAITGLIMDGIMVLEYDLGVLIY